MTTVIEISGEKIGVQHQPYVVAEMSANHNGSIENAFRISISYERIRCSCYEFMSSLKHLSCCQFGKCGVNVQYDKVQGSTLQIFKSQGGSEL